MTAQPPAVDPRHVPVMLERVIALLAPALEAPGAVFVDATVGLGGHSAAVLERCPSARLVGLDRDSDALRASAERLRPFAPRVSLQHAVYDELPEVLARLGIDRAHGVLFDLGVSSLQLDTAARGFSYSTDAPLDMRMDPTQPTTAADIVADYPAPELARVLRRYGEERFARQIADQIARARAKRPVRTSAELVELVRAAIPAPARRHGGNPAKRTFQALRIEVNQELRALEAALPMALSALTVGGRVVVLSYQSLEDRLVKLSLTKRSVTTAPPGLPVIPEQDRPELRLLTRGAEQATDDEKAQNPRAASVRLRAAERIREAA